MPKRNQEFSIRVVSSRRPENRVNCAKMHGRDSGNTTLITRYCVPRRDRLSSLYSPNPDLKTLQQRIADFIARHKNSAGHTQWHR
ncbi:MAG: hypothetical protein PUP93_03630 [Rhizonema sp. NSF051]|nr:hypothetical protein [Rhizonema sp. NSF051]